MDIDSKDGLSKIDNYWKNFDFNEKQVKILDIKNFITDEHVDIIVRYLYVKAYIEKKNIKKYKQMYEKMQNNRIGKSNVEVFNKIIDSFSKDGYLKDYPIPVNLNNKLLNGSHRLACCLYFNINPYVVYFDEQDHTYELEWFKNNGFSDDELCEIVNTKNYLLNKYKFSKTKLERIYSAMITPLKNNVLDVDYYLNHANYLYKNGIKGLFVCGNTGNGMNLGLDTKKQILDLSLKMNKFSVICHVGSDSEKEIWDFVKYTNKSGVECIAAMPPYKTINKFQYIKLFYERLAKLSKKPVLIYHIPSITGIDLKEEELIELLKINNVIGIKFTDNNMEKLRAISTAMPDKYIFFGRDDYLSEGLKNGATGGIGGCYNLFPNFICDIINNNEIKTQTKLNYCISQLRKIYPTLPGGEFVLKSLKIKNNILDDEYYKKLKEEND